MFVEWAAGFRPETGKKARGIGYVEEKAGTLISGNVGGVVVKAVEEKEEYIMSTAQANAEIMKGGCPTMTAAHEHPIYFNSEYAARRLTPTECARLQGFPDDWCADVPHTDSAEYKMWGNGIALPCVIPMMKAMKRLLEADDNRYKGLA